MFTNNLVMGFLAARSLIVITVVYLSSLYISHLIILLGKVEMEEIFPLPQASCPQGSPALNLCFTADCDQQAFICQKADCECGRVKHKHCYLMWAQSLMERIMKTKQKLSPETQASFVTIIDTVTEMIEALSLTRVELEDARDNFGISPKAIEYLKLLREKKFDKVNGKLISEILDELKRHQKPMVPSKSQIQCKYKNKKQQFEQIHRELKSFLHAKSWASQITNQFPLMYQWIQQSTGKPVLSHKLLYRASEQEFKIAKFHELCDNIPNTFVLIKTEFDKVIGGFTPKTWNSAESNYVSEPKSFIFSLTLKEKMTNVHTSNSIYCHKSYGPIFGAHDILISDSANTSNGGSSGFPVSYNSNGKYERNQNTYTLFCGQTNNNYFNIKEWEVFQVIL